MPHAGSVPPADRRPAPAPPAPGRALAWSVRRELWEHRSLYLAPLVVAGVVLLASLVGMAGLPERVVALAAAPDAGAEAIRPFSMAPAPIMLATLLVGLFYSLEALHAERRDRSILFWKSLPVSDRVTVLSKACVPLAVLPAIGWALSVVTVACLLGLGSGLLLLHGVSPAPLWAEARAVEEPLIMAYGLAAHALWFAPIYGWLLLVSVWARRTPLLWAVLPPLMIGIVEHLAVGTSHLPSLLCARVTGAMAAAFDLPPGEGDVERLAQLDPLGFLAAPGLWAGLVFAAACLAAAAWLRRRREPL